MARFCVRRAGVDWIGTVLLLCFAIFFYRAAQFERLDRPVLWGGVSVLLFLAASQLLDFGLLGTLLVQVLWFVAMAVCIDRERRRRRAACRRDDPDL